MAAENDEARMAAYAAGTGASITDTFRERRTAEARA